MGHHGDAGSVGGGDQLAARIGDSRAAGLTHQSSIPTGEERCDQSRDLVCRGVFVQLADFDFLNWPD